MEQMTQPRNYNKEYSDHPKAVRMRRYYQSRTPEQHEHILAYHRKYRARVRATRTEEDRKKYNQWQKDRRERIKAKLKGVTHNGNQTVVN
jgi:hypothetical protein